MSYSQTHPLAEPAAAPRDRRMRLAFRLGAMLRAGTLTLVLPDGSRRRFAASPEPSATVLLHDRRAISRMLTGGNIGAAEAYIAGWWSTPDLHAVMALAAANDAAWEAALRGRPWVRVLTRLLHRMRPNTRGGARRNIAAHYDLGNAFYAEWLDAGMTYSAARFSAPEQALESAQQDKMHHLCALLGLRPGMRVLEIGCGWGGFAELAARAYGVQVVALTLSPAQLAHAQARIAGSDIAGQIEFRLQDYRDVSGRFDRIASIEMFEAVGERFWPTYFRTLRERLRPGGLAAIQTITITDELFPIYRRRADFIQRHVFPGGMLPGPSRLREEIARAGLHWREAHWFGQDYAETLARWHTAFQAAWPRIAHLSTSYDLRFKRLWEYYLAYCETGFRVGWTDVGQILLANPG